MKIYITKQEDELCVHLKRPVFCRRGDDDPEWEDSDYNLCEDGEKVLKAILNLNDWPKKNEIMEYDTRKQTAEIWSEDPEQRPARINLFEFPQQIQWWRP